MKPKDGDNLAFQMRHSFQRWIEQGNDVLFGQHGFLAYCWDTEEPGTVWTAAIWTHPAYRRQGNAQRMYQALARVPGIEKIRSHTNAKRADVTGMYQKAGHILTSDDGYWETDVKHFPISSRLKEEADRSIERGGLIVIDGGFIEWQWAEDGVIVPGAAWVHPDYRRQGLYIRLCGLVAEIEGAETYRAYSNPKREDITAAAELMGWKQKEQHEEVIVWENTTEEVTRACRKLWHERYGH